MSRLLEGLLGLGALAVPLAIGYLVWRLAATRSRRARAGMAAGVAISILLAQVMTLAMVGVAANRALGLATDWGSVGDAIDSQLNSGTPVSEDLTTDEQQAITEHGFAMHPVQPAAGNGTLLDYLVTGDTSHARAKVVVWIPNGYTRTGVKDLPAVMVIGGAYVSVNWVVNGLKFGEAATPLINARTVKPFIAVFPEPNIAAPSDTECFDFPKGPKAYSWLAKDIPQWAHSTFGTSRSRDRWTAQGWSLGGYCAAKLQATDPGQFKAAASMMGYFKAEPDATTGPLGAELAANTNLRNASNVSWLIRNRTPPDQLRIMAVSSPIDQQSYPQYQSFKTQFQATPGMRFAAIPGVGHNLQAWAKAQSTILPFLLH